MKCRYDDGEMEWIDSTKEQFEIVHRSGSSLSSFVHTSNGVSRKAENSFTTTEDSKPAVKQEGTIRASGIQSRAVNESTVATSTFPSIGENHTPSSDHSPKSQSSVTTPKKNSVHSPKKNSVHSSRETDDAYQPPSMDEEDEDIPISKLRRFIVSDSDSDTPILPKKTNTTPSKPLPVSQSPSKQYQSPSTPSKRYQSPSTPSKRTRMSDAGEDEGSLEKKGPVILNAGEHVHDHTDWMIHPRDKYNHLPSDSNYDPTSLYIPPGYLKDCTNGMKQWWSVKQTAFDCVLLMKVGKFYETYHMDADIMVKELDLVYMKGETAHAGFPEAAYSKFSNQLVNAGYRVARVEQTETPQQLKERNAVSAKKVGQKEQ